MKTKFIKVVSRWEQTHTFEVPADYEPGDLSTLDGLMNYIRQDVDGADDIQPDTAELVDWEVR